MSVAAPVPMSVLAGALCILRKDIRIELRTGEIVVTTSMFAMLVAVLTSLSFYVDSRSAPQVAPGVLWIAVAFSGVLAMGRSWARERDNAAIRALMASPIPRASIYLGKAAATLLFLMVVETLLVLTVAVLFGLFWWPLLVVVPGGCA